jgi:hypothetical protein
MEHYVYKEWIPLAVDGELSSGELSELEKHIAECVECRAEFEEQKKMKAFVTANYPVEPDEMLLFESRQSLRQAIRNEKAKEPFLKKLSGGLKVLFSPKAKLAFGGVFILLTGFLAGYFVFNNRGVLQDEVPGASAMLQPASDNFSPAAGNIKISNVRFIDQDARDGEVEFVFDAVKPVRIKGSINDENIKNILTYSMLNVENPGVRLNSINAISAEDKPGSDPEIKAAIISVAKFDENPGVRRQAIKLLSRYNYDQDAKNTLLFVLMNDSTSGNRIEAINSLVQAQKEGVKFSEEELSVFREKMEIDDNRYIRYQAKTVLMENN